MFEKNLGKKLGNQLDPPDFSLISGEQFEIFLSNFFEILGYNVIRTPLTGDQGADLIISKDKKKSVIQAKCYSNQPVGNGAIQEIVAAKSYYQANHAMVITNSTFTSSAIVLAEANHVELWDGKKLTKNIEEILNRSNK